MSVKAQEVVFVKGIIEASDGLAVVFAERGGELVIASLPERRAELSELLSDLARDIGLRLSPGATSPDRLAVAPSPIVSLPTEPREGKLAMSDGDR